LHLYQRRRQLRAISGMWRELLQRQGLVAGAAAALQAMGLPSGRCKAADQGIQQTAGLGAVISREIAYIHIQSHRLAFGPGMDRQMRFGQQQGAGNAGRAAVGALKGVEFFADDSQA